jgi:hypothetical protein
VRRTVIALALLTLVPLAACGDDGSAAGDEADGTGGEVETTPMVFGDGAEVLLRLHTGGGFVPMIFVQREVPSFLLFDDGRLVRHTDDGAEVVPEFQEVQLDETETAELLDTAVEVIDGPDVGAPLVTDLPTMTIEATADDGETRALSMYAPGIEDGLTMSEREARDAVDQLVLALDSAGGTTASAYVPEEWLALTVFSGIEPGGIARWPLDPGRMADGRASNVCTRLTQDEFDEVAEALEDGRYEGVVASRNGSAEIALRPVLTGDESCNLGEYDEFVER